jgi:hypothetical protein
MPVHVRELRDVDVPGRSRADGVNLAGGKAERPQGVPRLDAKAADANRGSVHESR